MRPTLSLWDTVSIMIGIVIGAGIFETAPLIFSTVNHPWLSLGVWVLGGVLSLIGALCYAELASAYPRAGGDYVYLSRSYGSWMGFLFGWSQLAVILTGSIGMMAYIFADYAATLWGLSSEDAFLYAAAAVLGLSALNLFGLSWSKKTQNLLSMAKILGLGLVVLAGGLVIMQGAPTEGMMALASGGGSGGEANGSTDPLSSIGLALIFVLYTYGGWNDAAFVAAEMRDRRQIPRALIFGTLAITVIYLLVNAAYLAGLGLEGAKSSKAVASDLLRFPFGGLGSDAMSLMVMVSALGAVNGLIFTGARVFSAMGSDHRIFARLSAWSPRAGVPTGSILTQALISVGLIVIVGSMAGRRLLSSAGTALGVAVGPWDGRSGFETLLMCTAPVFWFFFLLTGLSLFILRWKDPRVNRPFRVPIYPFTPLIFCLTCAYMLYRSVLYAGFLSLLGLLLLVLGLPLYRLSRRRERRGSAADEFVLQPTTPVET